LLPELLQTPLAQTFQSLLLQIHLLLETTAILLTKINALMLKLLVNQAFVPPRLKLEGLVLSTVIVQLEDIAILLEIRPVLPSLPLVVLVLLFNQSLWLLLNVDLELIASIRNALFYIPSPQAKTLLFPQPLLNPLLLHFVKQELLITLEVLLLGSVLPVLKTRIRPP
jgi:hypothetical protein